MGQPLKKTDEVKDYYDILEIPYSSTHDEINEAYQKAKNTYCAENIALHSVMTEEECNAVLELVEEAYSVLGEPGKRQAYDNARGFSQQRALEDRKAAARSQGVVHDVSQTVYQEAQVSKIAAINRFALDYKENPEMEERIESCQDFTGEFLREIREYKNVSIARMSNMTKVSKTYLKNIEEEDVEALPAPAYVRGFVYQYAKMLKLNPDYVANSYIARFKKKY